MLRVISRLLARLPLSWAILIVNIAGVTLLHMRTSQLLKRHQEIYSNALVTLWAVASVVLLVVGCRYVLDYTLWRRMQQRQDHSKRLSAYGAYAWRALQRRHRRWPRIPISELFWSREDANIKVPFYVLMWQAGICFNGWVSLDKWSFLALLLLQIGSLTCWVFTQRYTPRQHRSWRVVSPAGKVSLSFSPKTYKANRLRNALLSSGGAVLMAESGVEKLLGWLHHTTSTKDGLLGTLAMFGPAVVIAVFAVQQWRAYLRWRSGQVTMDDVSEEIEWMLEQSQKAKSAGQPKQPSLDLKQEYFEHRSNVARVEWSWDLRKHELVKSLRLQPTSYYLWGLSGLVLAEAVLVLGAWAMQGTVTMWVVIAILITANVLGIIAWIVGGDDELPPLPPADKPIPTPGQGLALPKTRPRVTSYKPQRPLLKP